MKAIFQKMGAIHEDSHLGIHNALVARGENPDDTGSFMSTVHRTAIGVRSAVVGLDRGSLASFASGKECIVKDYDAAIEANSSDAPASDMLTRQKGALVAVIAELKSSAA